MKVNKLIALPVAALLTIGGGALATVASLAGAQTQNTGTATTSTESVSTDRHAFPGKGSGFRGGHGRGPGVMGEVTAVNGSTITVTGKNGQTYTVNAGSATVQKMVTGSVSDITVGDSIGVQGTVSGNTVTATNIMSGMPNPPAQAQ